MAEDVLSYVPMLIYMAWAVSYYFSYLLKPKRFVKSPRRDCFLVILPLLLLSMYLRKWDFNVGTALVQMSILLVALVMFRDRLRLRLVSYVVFMVVLISVEVYATTLFLVIKQLTVRSGQAATALSEVRSIYDLILLTCLDIGIGSFLYYKATPLLAHLLLSVKSWTIFQLVLPLYMPFIMQFFIYQRARWGLGGVVYFSAFLICYPAFLRGIKSVKNQERERVLKEKSIQLAKTQLEASMKMETEYRKLRKWNHDIENHLLALSYLMDMKKYEEAADYYTDFAAVSDAQRFCGQGDSYEE
ncbi:hypothetical protein [Ruminococcus sp. 5_1_39BFAA]|uniref:hypothetical protein n=1 Tax=Ruminococcus sp. 5_1_39BFAA TaxID=457412 RepID=UPI0035659EE3